MLIRLVRLRASRFFSTTAICSSPSTPSSAAQSGYVTNNPNLKRESGQRDITNLDILEERIKERSTIREIKVGGQTQKWAYRSEVVGKLGLDNDHRNIWAAYLLIIIFGFSAFVYVKSQVVLNRKEEMEERERIRKSLNLLGSDRKKIGVVDN